MVNTTWKKNKIINKKIKLNEKNEKPLKISMEMGHQK